MNAEIYIGGKLVSVADDGDFPILLARSAADAQDPSASKADRSFTVKLVNDDAAKQALRTAWRADAVGTFQRLAAIPNSQVYGGGRLLLDGLFFLTAVNADEVEGFFVASAKSFAQTIAGQRMSDLPLRSLPFRGVATQNAVNAAFETAFVNDRLENFGYDCLFPFALFGFNFLPNYWGVDTNRLLSATGFESQWGTSVNLPASRPILDQSTWAVDVGSVGHIDFRAVPPAFLLTRLVRAIIEAAGYAPSGGFFTEPNVRKTVVWGGVDAEWNWVDLATGEWNLNNAGLRLTMFYNFVAVQYFVNGYSAAPSSYDRDWISTAPHPFNAAWTDEVGEPVGLWRAIARRLQATQQVRDFAFAMRRTAFWTAPADGVYQFTLTLDVIGFAMPACYPADGSRAGVGMTVCPSGEEPEYLDGNWLGGGPDLEGWENVLDIVEVTGNGPYALTATRLLKRGDAVVCWAALTHWAANQSYSINQVDFAPAPPVPEIPLNTDFLIDRQFGTDNEVFTVQYIEAAPDARFPASVNLHPARSLPDLAQSEFLAAVRRAFNLYIDVNERTRSVSVDFVQDLFLAPAPAFDLTNATDRSSAQLKPPNVASSYAFAWGDDSGDYAGQQVEGRTGELSTGVLVNAPASVSGSPLTIAAVETVRVLAATNPGSFVNPLWFVASQFDTVRVATEAAYFAPINTIEEPAEYAMKLAVLTTVDQAWLGNVPRTRVFDLTQPLGSRDYLADWAVRFQFTNAPLRWGAMIDRHWFRWVDATAAGHTIELDAWLTAEEFAAITVRATLIIDGVDYALVEARGFNPARPISRTRLRLARK